MKSVEKPRKVPLKIRNEFKSYEDYLMASDYCDSFKKWVIAERQRIFHEENPEFYNRIMYKKSGYIKTGYVKKHHD